MGLGLFGDDGLELQQRWLEGCQVLIIQRLCCDLKCDVSIQPLGVGALADRVSANAGGETSLWPSVPPSPIGDGPRVVHGVVDVLNEGGMHEQLRAAVGVSHDVGVAH